MIKKAKELVNEAVKQIGLYQSGKEKPIKTRFKLFNRNALGGIFKGNIITLAGISGCVDSKTEYFNGESWIPISNYKEGDKVLQYTEEGNAELVIPTKYHKYPTDRMWEIKSKYGVNQCLSDEHNVVYLTSKGNLYKKQFKEVRELHEKSKYGFYGKFITTFNNIGGYTPPFNEFEFRLLIAIQADGHLIPNRQKFVRVNIKKERKKERLKYILNNINNKNIKYIEHKRPNEFSEFIIEVPIEFRMKQFPKEWYNLTDKFKGIFIDEIFHWDGSIKKNQYFNNDKQSIDICQFIFSSMGYRSTITEDKREDRSNSSYVVMNTKRNLITIKNKNTNSEDSIQPYYDHDGFKYCFTVPSSMLVLRREGRIFITGNSGKSHLLQQLEEDIFNKELNPNCDDYVLLRVNWEMSVFKLLLRRLKSYLGQSISDILFTAPSVESSAKMKEACDLERSDNIFYLEDAVTPEEFYKATSEFLEENKKKKHIVVTVDHIALIKASNSGKKTAIDDAIEYINQLKKEYSNVSFIVLSQLNRDIEARTDVRFLAPRRGDVYASDTIFQISDLVLAVHNPFKLGHVKYMTFETADYEYLSKYMTKPGERKSNFYTKGLIFHHYMKIRELQEDEYAYDLHIEEIGTFKPSSEPVEKDTLEQEMKEQGFTKIESLEVSPDFDENEPPF